MTVAVVMLSLAPILWESGIGSDVMNDRGTDRWWNDYVDH
jgi:Cu/Ag efflux pump CusA